MFHAEEAVINGFLALYGTLLVFGVIANALFMLAMFRGRKVLGQMPFYRIVASLLHLDCIYLLFQLSFTFPSMLSSTDPDSNAPPDITNENAWYNSTFLLAVRSVFDFLPSKGVLYLTLFMTYNRLAVFVIPWMREIFSKKYINWSLGACWALIWLFSVLCVLVRPTQKFNRSTLEFEDNGVTIVNAPALRIALDYSDYAVPVTMFVLYTIIYWSIRQKRRVISSATISLEVRSGEENDKRLLHQAIIICGFLQLYYIVTFVDLNVNDNGIWDYIINILTLTLSVVNHSVHSTIFIVSNPTIRGFLPRPRYYCCWKKFDSIKDITRSVSPIKH